MIKKSLIIFTIAMLLMVSTTPAIAQKSPEPNGKGVNPDLSHGNDGVKNDNHANGTGNNDSRDSTTTGAPPPANATNPAASNLNAPGTNVQNHRSATTLSINKKSADKNLTHGFDEAGYNRTARIFNGTGWSWCMEKVGDEAWCEDYLGDSANDHLIMKWNAEWDRGNAENWSDPPYDAWENNQWNGKVPGGSGSVWHYKIVWVGPCTDGATVPEGGYCIWGQFAVIMDQGTSNGVHEWFAHGIPTGYGSYP